MHICLGRPADSRKLWLHFSLWLRIICQHVNVCTHVSFGRSELWIIWFKWLAALRKLATACFSGSEIKHRSLQPLDKDFILSHFLWHQEWEQSLFQANSWYWYSNLCHYKWRYSFLAVHFYKCPTPPHTSSHFPCSMSYVWDSSCIDVL